MKSKSILIQNLKNLTKFNVFILFQETENLKGYNIPNPERTK